MLDALVDGIKHKDRRALARLLTLATHGEVGDATVNSLGSSTSASRVVAFTGPGGVGKSTLVGKLIEYLRTQGETVAVLACDPQSPITGGALLGDRFRMPSQPDDDVFIRSLSTASGHGAVAQHLPALIRILKAFGFANILVETVGAGQGDTAVREVADVVVVMLQPESGDEIQSEKAGLLEIADIVAIHKADLPGVERAEAELRQGLELSMDRQVPILRVSGKTGSGVELLWKTIVEQASQRGSKKTKRKTLLALAQDDLTARYASAQSMPQLRKLVDEWSKGELQDKDALAQLREMIG
jgi:LAO/AO transport system ATPase